MRIIKLIIILNSCLIMLGSFCFAESPSGPAINSADNASVHQKPDPGQLREQANKLYSGMTKEQAKLFASCARMKPKSCAAYHRKYISKAAE